MGYDVEAIRKDFPALTAGPGGKEPVYLDNACMTLRPRAVLDAMTGYYTDASGCHGRTDHLFGRRTSSLFQESRDELRRFLGARDSREVIFTRNATESINLVARGMGLKAGDRVLASDIEHNSNLVPWQVLAEQIGLHHQVIPTRPDTTFDMDALARALGSGGVRLVSILHTSNLTGVTFPIPDICELAHSHGARVLVDAAQAPLTHALDVGRLGADYLAISTHKMLGPSGMGILWVKGDYLDDLRPLNWGGETVDDTTYAGRTTAPAPRRFEAGLQDYGGAAGAAAAARYVKTLGPDRIKAHVQALNTRATQAVLGLCDVRILGPEDPAQRGSILNFVPDRIRSMDLARLLDEAAGIMVRSGRHCVHSWFNATLTPDSVRVSFGPYNTLAEVDALADHLDSMLTHFR